MNLTIKSINESNYKEILKLKVSKNQVGFIESIEESLNEAKKDSKWKPVGIYNGEKAVGFAMYALFKDEGENGRVWLDRFLISHENQGMGYGKAGVKILLKKMYEEYGYNNIYLSVYENNKGAISLYSKIGFRFNGEVDVNGEKVMVINLDTEYKND